MTKFTLLAAAAFIAIGSTVLAPSTGNAFKLETLLKVVPGIADAVEIDARVNVHNYYAFPIQVVMDSNRESHVIQPGGVAKFTKANVGDKPTWRAYRYKNGARSASAISTKSMFLDGNKTLDFRS